MNFFVHFFILFFSFLWIIPVHSREHLIQRRLTAMNEVEISHQGSYIKHSKENGFSGEIEFQYQDNTLKNSPSNTFFSGYLAQFKGGWSGEISENFSWGIRLASGGLGQGSFFENNYALHSDVNRSQPLGGFSGSPIWLDSLYFTYFLNDRFLVRLGQMENPYFDPSRYNVIWDEDLTPSGLVFQYEQQFQDRYTFSLLGSGFIVSPLSPWTSNGLEEVLREGTQYGMHRYMLAGSGRFKVAFDDYDFVLQTSYYNIQVEDMPLPLSPEGSLIPNLVTDPNASVQTYENNFSILDIALQMRIKNFWKPVLANFQLVQNFEDSDGSIGVVAGGSFGESHKKGAWNLSYNYFSLDRDVTMSHLTNSDIGGIGSDYKGHSFQANYYINSALRLSGQYILRDDQFEEEGVESAIDHAFFVSIRADI